MPLATGDALSGSGFALEIDGVAIAQFASVSGLSASVAVIEHRENGKGGRSVVKKLPGPLSWGDLLCRHGRTVSNALWDWFKLVQDGKINEARRNASVVLFDYEYGEVVRYNLVNCWISQVKIGDLSAGANTVMVEEATLCHEGLTVA